MNECNTKNFNPKLGEWQTMPDRCAAQSKQQKEAMR